MEIVKKNTSRGPEAKARVPRRLDWGHGKEKSTLAPYLKLAKKISGAEYAGIHLEEEHRLMKLAGKGSPYRNDPASRELNDHSAGDGHLREITDLSMDPRYRSRSFVRHEPHYRYFLGLATDGSGERGQATLCLLNRQPLHPDKKAIALLETVAEGIGRELKHLEAFSEMEQEVENSRKKVAKVAHDIRNSVAAIITGSHMMEEEEDPLQAMEFLKIIRESAQRLLEYAEDQLHKNG